MTYTTYPLGDFLIRIKNAALANIKEVSVAPTSQIKAVAATLKRAGFLDDYSEKGGILTARLSFTHKRPVLMDLKLVSKPGLRIYMGVGELGKKKGPSVFLVSTGQGILFSKEALKKRVGGEVIAEVL